MRRKLLFAVIVLLVLVIALVGLAPTILSMGPGASIIASRGSEAINGTVAVDSASFGWFSDQSITGLRVTHPGGDEAANVDVTLHGGLLSLLSGGLSSIEASIGGRVAGTIDEKGRIDLVDLAPPPSGQPKPPGGGGGGGPLPAVTVTVTSLDVELDDAASNQTITLAGLTGEARLEPGRTVALALATAADEDPATSELNLSLTADGLVAADGSLTPAGATLRGSLDLAELPLPVVEPATAVERLTLTLRSDDLTEMLTVDGDGLARVRAEGADTDAGPSDLRIALRVPRPFDAAGRVTIEPVALRGSVEARAIPTALLDLVTANAPNLAMIDARRDLGERLDVELRMDEGVGGTAVVRIVSEHLEVDGEGTIDPDTRAVSFESASARLDVAPELARELAGAGLERRTTIRLDVSDVRLPGEAADGSRPLADATGSMTLRVEGPVEYAVPDVPAVRLEPGATLSAALGTSVEPGAGGRLADGIALRGSMDVSAEGGTGRVSIDQRIAGVLAMLEDEDVSALRPGGRIEVASLPIAVVESFAGALPDTARRLLGRTAVVTLETGPGAPGRDDEDVAVRVSASSGVLEARVDGGLGLSRDAIRVGSLVASTPASPQVVAVLQQPAPGEPPTTPIRLIAPDGAQLVTSVEPLTLARGDDGAWSLRDETVRISVRPEGVPASGLGLADVPNLLGPIEIRDLVAAVVYRVADGGLTADADLAVAEAGKQNPAASIRLAMLPATGDGLPPTTVTVTRLKTRALERLVSGFQEPLPSILGLTVDLELDVREDAGTRVAALTLGGNPQLDGDLEFAIDSADVLTVRRGDVRVTMPPEAVTKLLAPAEGQPATVRAVSDLTANLDVASLRAPLGLFTGEPVDPATIAMDLTAALTGIALAIDGGERLDVARLPLNLRVDDLARGLRVTTAAEGAAGADRPLAFEGTFTNFLDAERRLATDAVRGEAVLTVDGAPVAVLDALGGMNGLLVAAIGSTMDGRIELSGGGAEAQPLTGSLTTANGSRLDFDSSLGETGLRLAAVSADPGPPAGQPRPPDMPGTAPLDAKLRVTSALVNGLLANLNPILGDLVVDDRAFVSAAITEGFLPIDGDLRKLDATARVVFDSDVRFGGTMSLFRVLSIATERTGEGGIVGRIEPISITIDDGVVRYDRFRLQLDKYAMSFDGSIDLATRQASLTAYYPLAGLASTFGELSDVGETVVPIKLVGPLGALEPQVDVQSIADQTIKNRLQRELEKALDGKLPGGGGGLPSLLDPILGGGEDDDGKQGEGKKGDGKKGGGGKGGQKKGGQKKGGGKKGDGSSGGG